MGAGRHRANRSGKPRQEVRPEGARRAPVAVGCDQRERYEAAAREHRLDLWKRNIKKGESVDVHSPLFFI